MYHIGNKGMCRVNRLRMAREAQGMSQQRLAEAMGVTATSISRYETGVRQLSVEKAKRIACVLNADWVSLFEVIDERDK